VPDILRQHSGLSFKASEEVKIMGNKILVMKRTVSLSPTCTGGLSMLREQTRDLHNLLKIRPPSLFIFKQFIPIVYKE
jgi:hypothetical protein